MSHERTSRPSLLLAALSFLSGSLGTPLADPNRRYSRTGMRSRTKPNYQWSLAPKETFKGRSARRMTRAQAKILIQDARSKQRVKQVAEAVRYSFDTGKWTVRLNNGQWLVARTFEGLVKNIGGMSELKADQLWAYLDKNRNQWITFVAETSSVKKRGVSFA